jgi:integrase/recombinase XerD
MIRPDCFNGPLGAVMADFIACKRMQGYTYETQTASLRLFDLFIAGLGCSGDVLQGDLFRRYQASIAELAPGTQEGYLSVVRVFSRYLHALRPESAVMPVNMQPRYTRTIRFHRISPGQIQDLMEAAADLRMHHPAGPHAARFLIGLLYSTGLRISEALKLDLGDVDLRRGTLYVRRGKFAKDRLVVLTASALDALRAWLKLRSRYAPTTLSAPLLPGGRDGRLTYAQCHAAFSALCRRCGLHGEPPPRLHDLRHNFACRCIARWREAGEDVQALLPVLANAMGHVSIFSTQLYVHMDAGELQQASLRFKNHFTQNNSKQGLAS